MEHVIFISDIPDLKYFKMRRFSRVYYGNEFCEHLMPSAEQVRAVSRFTRKRKVPFSLVMPILYEPGMKKAETLLDALPKGSEVIFNDIGLLDGIRRRGLTPIHGRMLFAAIKDPRIGPGTGFSDYFTAHNLQKPYLDLLKSLGVNRVEIDNAAQGYNLDTVQGMPISIYYPFVHCTVTRKCVFANLEHTDGRGNGFVASCGRACAGRTVAAKIGDAAVAIMGNAQFYRNDAPPLNLDKPEIDRMVYMPVFPNNNSGVDTIECLEWSHPYATGEYAHSWGEEPDKNLRRLLRDFGPPAGARVLDCGCGAGRNAPTSRELGYEYTGIDIASAAINIAKTAHPDARFITGSILDYKWGQERFDAVLDYGCFHTLAPWERKKYFRIMARLLPQGGCLVTAAWDDADSETPHEYVCGTLPEWACSQSRFEKEAGHVFTLLHTEQRKEGKWRLRYYVMKKKG